ncbi:MAG: hypothetical protein ACFFDK_13705 [Promethearchaeota archaeon]
MVIVINLEGGIPLFSRIFEKFCQVSDDEIDLIGCFVNAIELFSKNLGQDGIRKIEMSDVNVLIYEKHSILMAFIIDLKDNLEEYQKKLSICLGTFLKDYSDVLINDSYHNISIFNNFNITLRKILDTTIDEINLACPNCEFGSKCDCLYEYIEA